MRFKIRMWIMRAETPNWTYPFQGFGSVIIFPGSGSGSGSSVWGWRPIRIRIQGFNDQKLKKNNSWKKIKFFWSKTAIYLSLGLHKYVQVTEEAFSSQKRPPNTSKHDLLQKFSTLVGHFCPPGSGSGFRIRIRIHWPDWINHEAVLH
jgi:hypothetical protein